MENKPKYGIGDKVAIVNYGHAMWYNKKSGEPSMDFPVIEEDETFIWHDTQSHLVGMTGLINEVSITQGVPKYSIAGIGSWYGEKQLELISKNPNNE
ncbi:MAG TPA: hypothetical protein VEA37_02865 [Flavobacterium sp.]|nr:hypothetical protein [Flavobacterium sp.]